MRPSFADGAVVGFDVVSWVVIVGVGVVVAAVVVAVAVPEQGRFPLPSEVCDASCGPCR